MSKVFYWGYVLNISTWDSLERRFDTKCIILVNTVICDYDYERIQKYPTKVIKVELICAQC